MPTDSSDTPNSFISTERCLEATGERMSGFPLERIRLLRLIAHIQRAIETFTNRVLYPHGLSYSSYITLMMLYGSPDFSLTPSALSEATGERRNNITRISDDLVKKGLIAREVSQTDRRCFILTLNQEGRRLLEYIQPKLWANLNETFGDFSNDELQLLRQLLHKQLTGMDKHRE